MSDIPSKETTNHDHESASAGNERLGSIATLLFGVIDFYVMMGMSVESRDDGRQLVLKYFGPRSLAAEQRSQRFREWCVWVLVGVPIGGTVGGWWLSRNPSIQEWLMGSTGTDLRSSIELSCGVIGTAFMLWLPFVLRGSKPAQ